MIVRQKLKFLIFLLFSLFLSSGLSAKGFQLQAENGSIHIFSEGKSGESAMKISGESHTLKFNNGRAEWPLKMEPSGFYLAEMDGNRKLIRYDLKRDGYYKTANIPLWLSILPPLIAIILALILKEVVISLFIGIWSGAMLIAGFSFSNLGAVFKSLFDVISSYIVRALNDGGHLSVIVFSLLIGGMVAIISKNGGMAGVVDALSRYAKNARSTQFVTWLLGISIFFDDYANTLIVGNTMRSVTDKFKISREKLAYIVDSTAAPVAAIAFVTTWIGAELTYVADGVASLGVDLGMTPYALFIASLRFSFYPILALIFILLIIYQNRDFGPMYKSELRARTTGQVVSDGQLRNDDADMENLDPVKNAPKKARFAVIPVATVVLVTILGLIYTGFANSGTAGQSYGEIWAAMGADGQGAFQKVGMLIGNSDSYQALLWSSLSGVMVAIAMSASAKIMSLKDTIHFLIMGFKTMLPAIIILTLAWTLAITTQELHTADYLAEIAANALHPMAIPAIIFILAAFISFSTGSSWSTMAILYPIAIPTTWAICTAAGYDMAESMPVLLNVISTVLAASVLGDHCSPISDTTILSSLASDCNHIDHVRTQLPYAVTVGVVSLVLGTLATMLGGSWAICLLLMAVGVGVLYLIIRKFGKELPA